VLSQELLHVPVHSLQLGTDQVEVKEVRALLHDLHNLILLVLLSLLLFLMEGTELAGSLLVIPVVGLQLIPGCLHIDLREDLLQLHSHVVLPHDFILPFLL